MLAYGALAQRRPIDCRALGDRAIDQFQLLLVELENDGSGRHASHHFRIPKLYT